MCSMLGDGQVLYMDSTTSGNGVNNPSGMEVCIMCNFASLQAASVIPSQASGLELISIPVNALIKISISEYFDRIDACSERLRYNFCKM